MKKKTRMAYAFMVLLAVPAAAMGAADAQQQGYGHQLLTEQERNVYRERMRAATSAEQRAQIRDEHHELVRERAKARGITIPEKTPTGGMGQGQGRGMGKGGGRDR